MFVQKQLATEKQMMEMEVHQLEEKVGKLPKHSILSLKQILSLEFLGEQNKDSKKPYPLLLANFLTSPFLLGVEEEWGDLRFRCVEQNELEKALREVAGVYINSNT